MRKFLRLHFLVATFAASSLFWFDGKATAQKLLADGTKDLSDQISTSITREQKHRVAVLPFRELSGQSTLLGSYLAEELVTHLVQNGQVDIVERAMLDRVLGELKLDQSGLIDPESAKKVGRLSGADAVLSGTITNLATFVAVNCRIIDAESGRILGAAQVKIAKDADVMAIMGVQNLTGASPAPSPARTTSDTDNQKPTGAKFQQEMEGFLFELHKCNIHGDRVDCDLSITNRDEDRELHCDLDRSRRSSIYARMIDSNGKETLAESGWIGSNNRNTYSSMLIGGVATRANVSFSGISSNTTIAKVLEIPCSGNRETFKVQFRNVPLQTE